MSSTSEGEEVEEDYQQRYVHRLLSLLNQLNSDPGSIADLLGQPGLESESELEEFEESEEEASEESEEEAGEAASGDEETAKRGHPKVHRNLRGTDLAHTIIDEGYCAAGNLAGCSNVHRYIRAREGARLRHPCFTPRDKSRIQAEFLPNRQRRRQAAFDDQIFCGTYSQDGDVFMSACQDGVIRFFDTSDPTRVWPLKREVYARDVGWAIVDTCYSPDRHFVIYSSWSRFVHLVTLDGERHEALPLMEEGFNRICPFSIRFSADSREILCGTNLNAVYIYDCIRDHLALSAEVHETDVNAVAFADASSNIFITGSDDYLCKVWDRRSLDPSHPVPVGTLVGHQGGITYIDSKNDGRYFISQGKDSVVKLWDIRRMEADPQRPRVNYRQDYRYGPIRHRSRGLRNDMSLMTYKGHEVRRTLIRARFSPASTGQRYIYSGSGDGSIYIWNVLDGSLEDQLAGHQGLVRDVSWHPDKPALASSSFDGQLLNNTYDMDGKWEGS